MFTSLIPAPYNILARIVAYALVAASLFGYGYVKGKDGEQLVQQAADTKRAEASLSQFLTDYKRSQVQAADLRAEVVAFHKELEDARKTQAGAAAAIAYAQRLRNNAARAAASATGVSGVPSVRPGTVGLSGASSVDAELDRAVQLDAPRYGPCEVQLRRLINTAIKAGANKANKTP